MVAKNQMRRKDRICNELKEKVKDYFLDPVMSRQVPCKCEVVNLQESGQKEINEKHIMVMTLKDAYNNFMLKYEEEKIGFTSFCKLKPQHVRQVSETNHHSCLCAICCIVAFKTESMNKLSERY